MDTGLDQAFLSGLGIAPPVAAGPVNGTGSETIKNEALSDDPSLWTAPEQGGFADGFVALVDDLHDTEKRIGQGNQLIADTTAAKKPIPAGWRTRFQNLTAKRLALRKQLTDQYPRAVRATGDLVSKLVAQEDWLRDGANDPRFADREDVWLATLNAYDRLSEAIGRAFVTVAEETAEDAVSVAWTSAWSELEAMGFGRDRAQAEQAIGGWDVDPREVVRRAKEARLRTSRSAPRAPPEPPLLTIAQVKTVMNCIAEQDGLPVQFDENGNAPMRTRR